MSFHPDFQHKATEAAQIQSQLLGHRLRSSFLDEQSQPGRLLNACQRCGRRVEITHATHNLCGEALTLPCDGDAARSVESRAWLTGQVPTLLLLRLQAEVEALAPALQARFDPGEFAPEDYCLYSEDGALVLRWQQREDPDWPVGQDNPQEAGGVAWLEEVVPETAMRAAHYTGPRLNPNGHENSELWIVMPLETGEVGQAYEDTRGRWRFRRTDGVVGYFIDRRHLTFEKGRSLPNSPQNLLPGSAHTGSEATVTVEEADSSSEPESEEVVATGAG